VDQELLHGTVFRWSANAFLINLPFHRDAVQQPSQVFQAESSCLGAIWCRLMHSRISWPVSGHYLCSHCGRCFKVDWQEPGISRYVGAESGPGVFAGTHDRSLSSTVKGCPPHQTKAACAESLLKRAKEIA
jgi:hypothetical protein